MRIAIGSGIGYSSNSYNKGGGFLLDKYSGAAAAYSLRQLSKDTTNVVRVRRSSDNTEQDFTANEVTDGTLAAFCGAGDGFVVTWYDQSASGFDFTNSTASQQVQIVSSGLIITENSKPTLKSDGVDDILRNPLTNDFFGTKDIYFFSVSTGSGNGTIFEKRNSIDDGNFAVSYFSSRVHFRVRDDANNSNVSFATTLNYTSQTLVSASRNSAVTLHYPENISFSVVRADLNSTSDASIFYGGGYGFFNGNIQEIIIYTSDKSSERTKIEQNIANYYGITL